MSHWDSFAATPGTVIDASDARIACDHYHRWPEDLDLIAAGGFDLYRFSSSWARLLPEGDGAPNSEGLDFYDRLVDGMLARGLRPALTLYHWDLPAALAARGGWQARDTALRMADYATLIARRLGDRLWSTAPMNEPWCVAWLAHFLGAHAPGLRDIRAAARASHHILLAHGLSVAALRAEGLGNLGAVVNLEAPIPADDTPEAAAATARFDALMNRLFLDPIFHARYPTLALDGIADHLPPGWPDDMATIAAPLDWLGISYYTARRIASAPGRWPGYAEAPALPPLTTMGWELYPQGLTDLLIRTARDHTGALPLFVTENGSTDMAGAPSGTEDRDRIAYLAAHFRAAQAAIAAGVPLTGYIIWSLMDNFEWALGYSQAFGLVAIDRHQLAAHPKGVLSRLGSGDEAMMDKQVLVADVGGTNTRVALARGGTVNAASVTRYVNADHPSLTAVLADYVAARANPSLSAAAAAIAGPVEAGHGRLTNLDWDIDGPRIEAATGAATGVVMNDLVAQGHALGHLPGGAFRAIRPGAVVPGAARLVIGIGTGFNAAPVHDGAGARVVAPSECGHITLPTLTADDRALADDIARTHGFPGVEEVLSGRGLLGLYHRAGAPATARSADLAAALDAGDATAAAAADRFARTLGMVVGDLALIHLPFGGIHLIGGVARALAPRLAHPVLGQPFRDGLGDKGRFSDFTARFDISLIEDDFAALTGMAAHLATAKS